jgi:hypothetical protein
MAAEVRGVHPTAKSMDTELPRYLTSYRARRAYSEEVQVPPSVKGVQGAIDIHCHATENQQDAKALARLAAVSGMGGLLFKSISGGNEGAAGSVRKLQAELDPWCEEAGIQPLKMWAGYGIGRSATLATPQQVKKQIDDGVVAV